MAVDNLDLNENEEFDNKVDLEPEEDFSEENDAASNSGGVNEMVSNNIAGLNDQERKDPNNIKVTITDEKTPLVILYGPANCGKTMTLIRLARFLRREGYTIEPERTFRPSRDEHYKSICDNFDVMLEENKASNSTSRISFLLAKVLKGSRTICQILEAPGEYYFNPDSPKEEYPYYLNEIMNGNVRKLWAIFLEPNWKDHDDRRKYKEKIQFLKPRMKNKDGVLFVLNKIDKWPQYIISDGNVKTSEALMKIEEQYCGVFDLFKNENPITSFFKKYNCEFVPFKTGDYNKIDEGQMFTEGAREYCVKLWGTILKLIRG